VAGRVGRPCPVIFPNGVFSILIFRQGVDIKYFFDGDTALEKLFMQTKILVVDDDPSIVDILCKMITNMGFTCRTARDGEEALELLRNEPFDIILTDIRMPHMDGMQLLKEVKLAFKDIDVMMMTVFQEDYSYTDVIKAGATDFITKPFRQDELEAKIIRILNERLLKTQLLYLSIRDGLTGLFNRRYFYQKLLEEVERAKRQRQNLSLIILDIDGFKDFNDTHGHLEGDHILATLGHILTSSIRQNVDSAYRYGGDEFAVLLVETDLPQANRIAERIRTSFESKGPGGCTLSLGVAQLNPKEFTEDLIERADKTMYRAKKAGGNRVERAPSKTRCGPER
jgi:two-component system cell cycle response regulator